MTAPESPARGPEAGKSIVLFDGVCNLCNGFIQFAIPRDPHDRFRFASLQSEAGRRVLRDAGQRTPLPDSLVFIDENRRVLTRSSAALGIARRLSFPFPLLFGLVIIPRPLRDWLYDVIARRRYQWFGRRDTCMVPTPALRAKFLSGSENIADPLY